MGKKISASSWLINYKAENEIRIGKNLRKLKSRPTEVKFALEVKAEKYHWNSNYCMEGTV